MDVPWRAKRRLQYDHCCALWKRSAPLVSVSSKQAQLVVAFHFWPRIRSRLLRGLQLQFSFLFHLFLDLSLYNCLTIYSILSLPLLSLQILSAFPSLSRFISLSFSLQIYQPFLFSLDLSAYPSLSSFYQHFLLSLDLSYLYIPLNPARTVTLVSSQFPSSLCFFYTSLSQSGYYKLKLDSKLWQQQANGECEGLVQEEIRRQAKV